MPRPQEKFDTREAAVICNITFVEYHDQQPFGPLDVLGCQPAFRMIRHVDGEIERIACAPGKEYALTEIEGKDQRTDTGDKNSRLDWLYAMQIAEDFVKRYNGTALQGVNEMGQPVASFMGLFVCAGDKPSADELAEAHRKLKLYYEAIVAVADSNWAIAPTPIMIDGIARSAARYLNLNDKPWLFDTRSMEKCPVCQKGIAPKTIKCPYCMAILNEAEARKYFLLPVAAAQVPATK
jgi:hypothetical protein